MGRDLVVGHLQGPLGAARLYALLGMAQYAAIVGVDESEAMTEVAEDGRDTGQGFGPGGRSRFELERGAVVGASARLLAFIYPDSANFIAQHVADETDAGPGNTHPFFARGIEAGQAMGDVMVAWAKSDHFNAPFTGTIPTGPGKWIPNGPPVGPTEGSVRPYFMSSGSQFRPPPPPEYLSDAYNTALQEVRTISDTRTPAQTAIALFWALNPGTPTALGHWDEIAATLIESRGLDERAAAHVLALMNTAGIDATIACFDAKYNYYLIRPSQADRQNMDEMPRAVSDATLCS